MCGIAGVQPATGRMRPMQLPNGATVIRDDYNPNVVGVQAGLNFLAQVQRARRIVVIGDMLDLGLTMRPRARDLGRRVAQAADMAVFLGSEADTPLGARSRREWLPDPHMHSNAYRRRPRF